jgi:hypothetical protein
MTLLLDKYLLSEILVENTKITGIPAYFMTEKPLFNNINEKLFETKDESQIYFFDLNVLKLALNMPDDGIIDTEPAFKQIARILAKDRTEIKTFKNLIDCIPDSLYNNNKIYLVPTQYDPYHEAIPIYIYEKI